MPENTYYAGIDWSEVRQDWAVSDQDGTVVARGDFREEPAGYAEFLNTLRQYANPVTGELPPVTLETDRGALVAQLMRDGATVYGLNPYTASRYRPQRSLAGSKNDKADAAMLADIPRLHPGIHRPVSPSSDHAQSLLPLARAHQDAVWNQQKAAQEIRSHARSYWPALIASGRGGKGAVSGESKVVTGVTATDLGRKPEILPLLHEWPTPAAAQEYMTPARVEELLRESGRSRYLDRDVARYMELFTQPVIGHSPEAQVGYGIAMQAHVQRLQAIQAMRNRLETALVAAVQEADLYPILESCNYLGDVTAARLLAEIGDEPTRFATRRGLQAFAGTAPVERQSGGSFKVMRRRVKSNRLAHAAFTWSMVALRHSPGAKAAYQRRRDMGDRHPAALRHVSNRLIGCLWHCIYNGTMWDDHMAWGHILQEPTLTPVPADEEDAVDDALDTAELLSEVDGEEAEEDEPTGRVA